MASLLRVPARWTRSQRRPPRPTASTIVSTLTDIRVRAQAAHPRRDTTRPQRGCRAHVPRANRWPVHVLGVERTRASPRRPPTFSCPCPSRAHPRAHDTLDLLAAVSPPRVATKRPPTPRVIRLLAQQRRQGQQRPGRPRGLLQRTTVCHTTRQPFRWRHRRHRASVWTP